MSEAGKVLVAGGGGFIGSHLVRRLAGQGVAVRAAIYQQAPRIRTPQAEYVKADLRSLDECRRVVENVDTVYMCAAVTSGAAVMRQNPLSHVTPNIVMNAHMLEAAYQAGVKKFVFISSGAAYPPTGDRPVREDEMLAGEPYDAYFPVAWMKRYTEILCRTYGEKIAKPMSCIVVRPSNVFGPYDKFDFATSHVTAALIRRVVERQTPLTVWGSGNDIRDLLYIEDFLDGLQLAAVQSDPYFAVNICSGAGHSVKGILAELLRLDGFDNADVRFDASKPSTIPVRLIDGTLARERLGFTPKLSLAEGLKRTMAWYRENPFQEPAP